ncbi:N-acetylneuraminate lyase [Hydrobacter penzbergensis]|uniref:N-acetylneuraminate lyase n=1 Tax=Hydrobacter penzbergensis TaxID=1235997 RepID=A0A8X8IFP1_9BACT|nr:dihydrodipicolinate synthase family protein [Hydrobacter penzbergensis]SDX57524.1 N-acetylneuraminate lyase [Hydrobacter penzbergensis]
MTIKHLSGLIAAPFTPMYADGSVNLSLIPTYYAFLKRNGVKGAFIVGSTGEGVSLSLEEKKAVIEAWGACTKGDMDFKVMPLLGGTSLTDCMELARYARSTNMYAVAFTAPFYFKPADAATLVQCCITVAQTVPDMPFYYYHIPVLTGVDIPMYNLLQELHGKLPNFAGIKYTHEDFMDFQSCLNFDNRRYDMLWGRDENMLSALAIGATGAVGSTYNYAAPLYSDLINAFNSNQLEEARMLQQQSIDMIHLLGKYGGIATGKAFMKLVGVDCGEFRLPVRNMSAEQFARFSADVAALGFSQFSAR